MGDFVAFDVETANAFMGSICQIGAVRFRAGQPVERLSTLIDPCDWFDPFNVSIHGIDEAEVIGAPTFAQVFPVLAEFVGNALVVHHTAFDRVSLQQACALAGLTPPTWQWLDSARVARRIWADVAQRGYGLAPLAERIGHVFQHHDAAEDACAAGMILVAAMAEAGHSLSECLVLVDRPITSQDVRRTGVVDGPLVGERIVFTGALELPRRLAADRAAALGADVLTSVSRETTMLVVGNQDVSKLAGHSKSTKHRKAEALIQQGHVIRIVPERDFLAFA